MAMLRSHILEPARARCLGVDWRSVERLVVSRLADSQMLSADRL